VPAKRPDWLEDAPWPPHFAKQPGEPKRVQPSRARNDQPKSGESAQRFGANLDLHD
jgi:hypothetical protein